jgi:hypothetical protein
MPLKYKFKSKEEVPAELAKFYAEGDGALVKILTVFGARILLPVPILMAGFAYFILLKGPMDLGALLYAGGIIISSLFLLNALKGSAAHIFRTPDQDEPVA